MPNYPQMEKQMDDKTDGNQEMNYWDVVYSSQKDEQRKYTCNYNNNEGNGEPDQSQKKKGSSSTNSKVKKNCDSEIWEKKIGSVQGENDQSGHVDHRTSRGDYGEVKILQRVNTCNVDVGKIQKSYAGTANPPQICYTRTHVAANPSTTQSYSHVTTLPQRMQQSYSHVNKHPQKTPRSYTRVSALSQGAPQNYSHIAACPRGDTKLKLPIQTPQSTKVNFYLLILGNYTVDQVYIRFGPDRTAPLELVDRDSNLFKCSQILPGDPIKDRFNYKYGLVNKGHDFVRKSLSDFCEEPGVRQAESRNQFDVFQFPEEKMYQSEIVPKSIIFYLKWLLQLIEPSTISEILIQIESFRFITFGVKHAKECVNWIVEHALSCTASDIQRLYLCIVLSYLDWFHLLRWLPNEKSIVGTCDRLLQCLNACVNFNFLSKSNLQRLGKIAIFLVKNSSSPGWLTLAAHFYPYLGVKYVLDEKHTKGLNSTYLYDVKEYKRIVHALLSLMAGENVGSQDAHQDILYVVLKHAPKLDAVWELFKNVNLSWFFTTEHEKVNFFVKFYHDTVRGTSTENETAGLRLIEFYKIPEVMRGRMRALLFSTLLEYAKSDEESNREQVNIFVESVTLEKYLEMYEVFEILSELSKSNSVPRQKLLLEILNSECFGKDWHETPFPIKVDVCKLWVITRVINKSPCRISVPWKR